MPDYPEWHDGGSRTNMTTGKRMTANDSEPAPCDCGYTHGKWPAYHADDCASLTRRVPKSDRYFAGKGYATINGGGTFYVTSGRDVTDEVAALRAERDEAVARAEQGGDLHALHTSGHHIESVLRDALGELESAMREDWPEAARERVFDLLDTGRRYLYEWDKRARRTGVDWWNRVG